MGRYLMQEVRSYLANKKTIMIKHEIYTNKRRKNEEKSNLNEHGNERGNAVNKNINWSPLYYLRCLV